MENWVLRELEKIYHYGNDTRSKIEEQEMVKGIAPTGEKARYIDICIDVITGHPNVCNTTIRSPYCTVEYGENKTISSIKVWFHKEKNELLQIEEIPYEYDSSENMWDFYDKIYKNTFKMDSSIIKELKGRNKDKFYRCYKIIDGIRFGGEVDFNFSAEGKKAKIDFFEKVLVEDKLCDESRKKEIRSMLAIVKERHHSRENVSIMPSNGNMQFTKQSIGNDRFDVMAFAIDEYCKGNTALLLVHCTPEYQKKLKAFIESSCFDPETHTLNTGAYFKKIYNINDDDLVQNLVESGKIAIDSAQRVLEYIALAYRVWICRANNYRDVKDYDDDRRVEELEKEYGMVKKYLKQ